jgi:hypothetical protein
MRVLVYVQGVMQGVSPLNITRALGSVRETLILLYVVPSDESTGVCAGGHAGGQSIKHHKSIGANQLRGQLSVLRGSVRQTSHALLGALRETLMLLYVVPSDESIDLWQECRELNLKGPVITSWLEATRGNAYSTKIPIICSFWTPLQKVSHLLVVWFTRGA